ncbi:hypothetical protein GCM10023196_097610 [Actinoallomurus vinaceus]|uniref:O-methyltransferase n=1 Tax=Actinoallomurus vinaceus TaxID=1080074 RepID=A0ABP8US21_9ACTN
METHQTISADDGQPVTDGTQADAVSAGLEDVDIRRIRQMVTFIRSHTTTEILAKVLPRKTPAYVAADLAQHCRFVHGSIMVFPVGTVAAAAGRLSDIGLDPGPPRPSTVVRSRVARRYDLSASDLQIQILHAALPNVPGNCAEEIEIFVCPTDPGGRHSQLVDDERRSNRETHFALKVLVPENHLLKRLWGLLTGPGLMAPDGGGFNPHEGPIGCTVLYFQTSGQLLPQGWPRRLELVIDGHQQILAMHLQATRAQGQDDLRSGPPALPDTELETPAATVPSQEEPTRRMLELLTGAWVTQALCVAAELGIADHLEEQPATSAELASLVNADADLLHRVLRYLASLGVVRRSDQHWRLTDLGRTLRTGALRDVARLYGGIFYHSFGSLSHSVRSGQNAFEHAFGLPPFEYLNQHPDQARIFHGAMAAGSSWFDRVPEVINFKDVNTVVDIAGGRGDLLRRILTASPSTRGVLFDQPAVIDAARETFKREGLLDRCELIDGDFTAEVPPGGDLYVLSRILHDWSDDQCVDILTNCREAMPETAVLAIIERPIPTDNRPSLAIAWDVHMSVNNIGGRERTVDEYRELLTSAGFYLIDERPLVLDMAVLTAAPYPAAN